MTGCDGGTDKRAITEKKGEDEGEQITSMAGNCDVFKAKLSN